MIENDSLFDKIQRESQKEKEPSYKREGMQQGVPFSQGSMSLIDKISSAASKEPRLLEKSSKNFFLEDQLEKNVSEEQQVPETASLGKVGYSITELSKILDIEPHKIRYWESRFYFLQPQRNSSGHRFYAEREVALFRRLKTLIVDLGNSISWAQKYVSYHGVEALLKEKDITNMAFSSPDGQEGFLNVETLKELKRVRELLYELQHKLQT